MKTSGLPKIFPDTLDVGILGIIRYPCYIGGTSMFKLALGGMMDSKINLVKNCEIE